MSHRISGFVGRLDLLREAALALEGERVVAVSADFGFLPLVERLKTLTDPGPFPELRRLKGRLAMWAVEQSSRLPLAYIETEIWAGQGNQGAVVWQAGAVIFGPVVTCNEGPDRPPLLEGAINRAARVLGVSRADAKDEFATLGLGRHRSNHHWLVAGDPTDK